MGPALQAQAVTCIVLVMVDEGVAAGRVSFVRRQPLPHTHLLVCVKQALDLCLVPITLITLDSHGHFVQCTGVRGRGRMYHEGIRKGWRHLE